jgi:hypothetical protein
MWGEIPATLIRVSYLLDSGEGAESIRELGLADDFEIPPYQVDPESHQENS